MCVDNFAKRLIRLILPLLLPLILAMAPVSAFGRELPILRLPLSRNPMSSKAKRSCGKSRHSRMPKFRPGGRLPSPRGSALGARVVDLGFDGSPPIRPTE